MICEACGGDGLIEIGAYRGDESDTNTRECKLCGGAVTVSVIGPADVAAASLSELVYAANQASEAMAKVAVTTLTIDEVASSLRTELAREDRPTRLRRRVMTK